MCGISGLVGAPLSLAEPLVAAMNRALAHRGPEGSSMLSEGLAVFGHTRLAFVDVRWSHQPFRHPQGPLLIAFNGEIYNHAEIRGELGCSAPGEAVLLAELFLRHGSAMVEKIDGMYAIAIYAAVEEALYLLRDPFGQKPLSYSIAGRTTYFASEAQALHRIPQLRSEVYPESLALYLTHNAVPPPHSLRRGIQQVPVGAVLRVCHGEVTKLREWRPVARPSEPRLGNPSEAEREVESALSNATRSHLAREVPYGFFLSGGLDSSLVTALAAATTETRPPCFTIRFCDAPTFDESAWASAVARHFSLPHHLVPLSLDELARIAERTLPTLDEPIADHSFLPTVALAHAARKEVKTVLTGDGADELLMGYRLFEAMAAIRSLTRFVPRSLLRAVFSGWGQRKVSERNLDSGQVAARLAMILDAPPAYAYTLAGAAFRPGEWCRILSPDAVSAVDPACAFKQIDELLAPWNTEDEAEQLQAGMLTHFLRHVILPKLDRATMLAGLEARSPFLSREFYELALRLPRSEKLHRRTGKHVLRRIARRYLPAAIIQRRKQGFRAPIAALLRGPLREFLGDHLSDASLRPHGLLNTPEVNRLLREHLCMEADHHRALWSLLCFQCWESNSRNRQ